MPRRRLSTCRETGTLMLPPVSFKILPRERWKSLLFLLLPLSYFAVSENLECPIIIGKSLEPVCVHSLERTHTHIYTCVFTCARPQRGSIFMADITRLISLEIISLFIGKVDMMSAATRKTPSSSFSSFTSSSSFAYLYLKCVRSAAGRSRSADDSR